MPSESWEIINSFYLWLKEKDGSYVVAKSPYNLLSKIKGMGYVIPWKYKNLPLLPQTEWHLLN